MKAISIIDSRLPEKCDERLRNLGFIPLRIPKNPLYDSAVSAHPDIFVFIYHKYIFAKEPAYTLIKQMFGRKECFAQKKLIQISEDNQIKKYPQDCGLNFAVCGEHIIGNRKVAHECVQQLALNENLKWIDVRQAYAKCNICIVSDNALITEDAGIAKSCENSGIDVLLLNTHSVSIEKYKYGFIGGASSDIYFSEKNKRKEILFCGNITAHPEYERIEKFCLGYNVFPVSLFEEKLIDCGSILLIREDK